MKKKNVGMPQYAVRADEEISLYHTHGTFVSWYRMVFLYA
jgi:hypothetical protein